MNWDIIKKGVLKEIESTIHTIDPAFDVDESFNLYIKILKLKISIPITDDLDGLEKIIYETLYENFIDGKIKDNTVGAFCLNFEQFVKKIYYILEEKNYVNSQYVLDRSKLLTLIPVLAALNKIRPIYLDSNNEEVYESELALFDGEIPKYKLNPENGSQSYKRLYPNSLILSKYKSVDDKELNYVYQNSFLLYLTRAYILKNERSHQVPERSRLVNITNFNSTLIAELWITNFFKKELTDSIKIDNIKNRDFHEYINSEITRLEKQNSKYVSLNLKELTNQYASGRTGLIENLLDENLNSIRILGQGGSGKTTTLEHLLYKDAINWIKNPSNSKLPVLISLANISPGETIIESIAKKINVDIAYVEELFETKELKIYLDGVNEIVINRESKKNKIQEIASLIDEYPHLNIIITDRYEFDSYQNKMFNIPTFTIEKLSKTQIKEFVEKYCNNSLEQSEHVLRVLESKLAIQELLLRPLVLTRAIEIIKIENDLPEKEGQIIEKFLDILLKREKDEKKDPLLNINNFKALLMYAAHEIWMQYKSNVPVHEYKFNKILVDAAEKYGLEKSNAGYISRIGYELEILSKNNDQIQFFHQSYIEFFCNRYMKYETQ